MQVCFDSSHGNLADCRSDCSQGQDDGVFTDMAEFFLFNQSAPETTEGQNPNPPPTTQVEDPPPPPRGGATVHC